MVISTSIMSGLILLRMSAGPLLQETFITAGLSTLLCNNFLMVQLLELLLCMPTSLSPSNVLTFALR